MKRIIKINFKIRKKNKISIKINYQMVFNKLDRKKNSIIVKYKIIIIANKKNFHQKWKIKENKSTKKLY